jgi:membrane associated rhomboid family serine protease
MFALPPVTRALILANVVMFGLQALGFDALLTRWLALWPWNSGAFFPWQLLTYGFLHGGLGHLFFNMFGIYMFGAELERHFGARRYMQLYAASLLFAALAQILVGVMFVPMAGPTVGASGGLFGLLIAFALLFPRRRILLLIPPIPMPAWLFVTLYGVIELSLGFYRPQGGIAHFAHLGGMLGGFLAVRLLQRR